MSQVLNLFDWANRSPKPRNNVIKFGTSVNKTEPMLQKKKICLDCGKKEITKKHNHNLALL